MTGWVAAVGQTILMLSDLISARVDAHPCPVSPRPCRKMREAVCLPLAERTTLPDILEEDKEEEEEEERENILPIQVHIDQPGAVHIIQTIPLPPIDQQIDTRVLPELGFMRVPVAFCCFNYFQLFL